MLTPYSTATAARPTATRQPLPLAQYDGLEFLAGINTVLVETDSQKGSGFVMPGRHDSEILVVTAQHVVLDQTKVTVCWVLAVNCSTASVVYVSKQTDAALLGISFSDLQPQPFAAQYFDRIADSLSTVSFGGSWESGDKVYIAGYPGQSREEPTVVEGVVHRTRVIYRDGLPLILIEADAGPGFSGGPVLSEHHHFVGILKGGFDQPGIVGVVPLGQVVSEFQEWHQGSKQ